MHAQLRDTALKRKKKNARECCHYGSHGQGECQPPITSDTPHSHTGALVTTTGVMHGVE